MPPEEARGSAKLAPMSVEDLHKSIEAARGNYKLTRWILKGIPPVYDRIQASLDVSKKEAAGQVVQGLVGLQTSARQVAVEVFPYGIPVIDGVQLNVDINFSTGPVPANFV